MRSIISFDKSALKDICEAMNIPYDENIIAFTKRGAITNICDLIEYDLIEEVNPPEKPKKAKLPEKWDTKYSSTIDDVWDRYNKLIDYLNRLEGR